MKALLLLLCCTLGLGACTLSPVVYDAERKAAAEATIEAFQAREALQRYFDEAVAFAVFPGTVRAGTGFGAALGHGWLFEAGTASGRVLMVEAFVGANLGLQFDRKILFFRTSEVLDQFKRGRFEFTGQANASAATWGAAVTPSYHPDVAMFVEVRGGLLLEASVGTQRYDYFPLGSEAAP